MTVERLTLRAALGARFWDVAAGRIVSDGLIVSTRTPSPIFATPNRSGVFVFHHLPSPSVIVDIRDAARRFVPTSFTVGTPVTGLFELNCSPGELPPAALPLYSAANRAVLPGMAVIRAQLQLAASRAPAAWAVLEVGIAHSIADENGHVLLQMPCPEPVGPPIGSPGSASGPPLTAQSWNVQVRVRYGGLGIGSTPPDVCAVLNQPPTSVASSPPSAWRLEYGSELVLRSLGPSGQQPLSVLLIGENHA